MDKKRGVVLVFSLIVTFVLIVLLQAFYFKSVSEKLLSEKSVSSLRAFWLAEAGIATIVGSTGFSSTSGSLGGTNYTYSVLAPVVVPGTGNCYWIVNSTGRVNLPSGSQVSRTLTATIKTPAVDASKFPYAIDTTTDLVVKGAVTINGPYKQNDNTINFTNMFSMPKATMMANATHLYTDSNFGAPVSNITWVNVASGNTLTIAGNLTGSGILVINGNAHFSGTVDFDGIIYVIGTLTMTGTVATNGSVIAESSATADTTLKGTVDVTYDLGHIQDALTNIQFLSKQVVAWREI